MRGLRGRLGEQMALWDTPTKIAMGLALGLLLVFFALASFAPDPVRSAAAIGVVLVVITGQVIFMWGNRRLVTPFTQAQRAYLAGDFGAAAQLLTDFHADSKPTAESLTLLGNTYRQLGRLDESEAAILQALALAPGHHFPLYGFGRTLLAQGRYTEAVGAIEQALVAGAPIGVRYELGEAHYRAGNVPAAVEVLRAATGGEPFRELMTAYILHLAAGEPAPVVEEGALAYWQASAERYVNTPYGEALLHDVQNMKAHI